jgi:hypothetical protein
VYGFRARIGYTSPPAATEVFHRRPGVQILGKMAKIPIWHRCVISAANHPLRQIGQFGRVLRSPSRACAQLDGNKINRILHRAEDATSQEASTGLSISNELSCNIFPKLLANFSLRVNEDGMLTHVDL